MTPAQVSEGLALTDLRDRTTRPLRQLSHPLTLPLAGQWQIVACSALTGQGLIAGMDWIAYVSSSCVLLAGRLLTSSCCSTELVRLLTVSSAAGAHADAVSLCRAPATMMQDSAPEDTPFSFCAATHLYHPASSAPTSCHARSCTSSSHQLLLLARCPLRKPRFASRQLLNAVVSHAEPLEIPHPRSG